MTNKEKKMATLLTIRTSSSQYIRRMNAWIKPLLYYRTQILAAEILDTLYKNRAEVIEINGRPVFMAADDMRYELGNYFRMNPAKDKYRVMDAVNLIAKDGYAVKEANQDWYKVVLIQNEAGRAAYNKGVYRLRAAKEIRKIALYTASILSVIAILIFRKNILELLQGLLGN